MCVNVHACTVYASVPFLAGDGNRPSLTEINLAPEEFDHYQVGVDAAITFCLKELRVRILLCCMPLLGLSNFFLRL